MKTRAVPPQPTREMPQEPPDLLQRLRRERRVAAVFFVCFALAALLLAGYAGWKQSGGAVRPPNAAGQLP